MTANDSTAPETRKCLCGHSQSSHVPFPAVGDLGWYGCVECDRSDSERCKSFCAPSDPPVGKDSSFEELLNEYDRAVEVYGYANRPGKSGQPLILAGERVGKARAALSRYVAQQREEIEDLRSRVVGLVSEVQQWKDALQSEIERQRGEIKELEGEIGEWSERWNSRDRSFGELWDENTSLRALHSEMVERLSGQRETTLTPEVKLLRSLTDYDWDDVLSMIPDAWGSKDILINLRSIASSSPLTPDSSK